MDYGELIDKREYEKVFDAVETALIDKSYGGRYSNTRFGMLLDALRAGGIGRERFLPLLLEALKPNSKLYAWKDAASRYLVETAYSDYNLLKKAVDESGDPTGYTVLIEADKNRGVRDLMRVRTAAARKILKNYGRLAVPAAVGDYADASPAEKRNLIKILLMFSYDANAERMLESIRARAPAAVAVAGGKRTKNKRTADADLTPAELVKLNKSDLIKYFEESMVLARPFTAGDFNYYLSKAVSREILDGLFFCERAENAPLSAYAPASDSAYASAPAQIFISDGGKPKNLDNSDRELNKKSVITIAHPADFTGKYAYLKSLNNIEQPFKQLRREFYTAGAEDETYNYIKRFSGAVVDFRRLKNNMRRGGFGFDAGAGAAYKRLGGVLITVGVAVVPPGEIASLGLVKLYDEAEVPRMYRRFYTDGAQPLFIKSTDKRLFSEALCSVSGLLR